MVWTGINFLKPAFWPFTNFLIWQRKMSECETSYAQSVSCLDEISTPNHEKLRLPILAPEIWLKLNLLFQQVAFDVPDKLKTANFFSGSIFCLQFWTFCLLLLLLVFTINLVYPLAPVKVDVPGEFSSTQVNILRLQTDHVGIEKITKTSSKLRSR